MKKWRAILCGFGMTVMLAACGGNEGDIQIVEEESITQVSGTEQENEESREDEGSEEVQLPEEPAGEEPESASDEKPAVVTIETEKQEYTEDETVIMTSSFDRVTVTVEGNEAATQAIMAEFEKREQSFQENLAESLEWAKQDMLISDSGMSYSENQGYVVERNDGRILSFSDSFDNFEGGAHGSYMEYGLNFDAETGKVLKIEDIAQDKAAFQEISVQEMLRQCEDLKAQGLLFEDEMLESVGGLQGIMENKMEGEEWYFTEEGIRFISNIYEIAPYAAGNFQFDIPYEMINDVLKEEYRG